MTAIITEMDFNANDGILTVRMIGHVTECAEKARSLGQAVFSHVPWFISYFLYKDTDSTTRVIIQQKHKSWITHGGSGVISNA